VAGPAGAGVRAACDRRLGREQAHASVARRKRSGARLRLENTDDRHGEGTLEIGQSGGGRRVARDDDELDALQLEEAPDLEREAAYLLERTGAVGQPRVVAEIEHVLVREAHEHLVEDGEPTHAGVEHADRSLVHAGIIRSAVLITVGVGYPSPPW